MRKTGLIAFVLLLFTHSINAKNDFKIPAKVDERIELLSVICRLAEFNEYVNNNVPKYAKDVDVYFAEFKSHELISLAKKLRAEGRFSYEAIASLATSIEIGNEIKLKNGLSLKGIKRWNQESLDIFIAHLNSFYKATNFIEFFNSHKSLYLVSEKRFTEISEGINYSWFKSFYGTDADFHLMLGMLNGYSNYGVTSYFEDGKEEINAIIGVNETDSIGNPIFSRKDKIIQTIIHEFSHSFCNRLIDIYYEDMETKAENFFEEAKEFAIYTGGRTMSYEILVRACVIKYVEANSKKENVQYLINQEKTRGFIWIQELYDVLSMYELEREKYPMLIDFMPQIVKEQNRLNASEIKASFEQAVANIVTVNIEDEDEEVDYKIDHLVIKFDRPVIENPKDPVVYWEGETEVSKTFNQPAYCQDETQMIWIVPINIKPNTKYTIAIPSSAFGTKDYFPLLENYFLSFKTRKE